jgi:hypothetical protein
MFLNSNFGGNVKKISRPLLTITVIFGSAFLLAAMGCGTSKSTPKPALVPPAQAQTDGAEQNGAGPAVNSVVRELSPAEITRECSTDEFSKLIAWRNLLNSANSAIDTAKDKKDVNAIRAAVDAVKACDSIVEEHASSPCRKTTKTVVDPTNPTVKYYDQARLLRDCKKSTDYLVKLNARPAKQTEPVVVAPSPNPQPNPQQPPVVSEPIPNTPPSSGNLRQCTAEEFQKLSDYSTAQAKADNSIKSLGAMANWQYEANAISSAALATKAVEALIKYHSQNPCQKLILQTDGSKQMKDYTADSLRARSFLARTYFYEFVQNTTTLIFPNADLYLDFSVLSPKVYAAGVKDQVSGNCLVENNTEKTIDYSNGQAKIVDTRGFEAKQIVMQTAEGLLISCYGLNVDGPFSKRQIVKVLKEEQSDIRLTYRLK